MTGRWPDGSQDRYQQPRCGRRAGVSDPGAESPTLRGAIEQLADRARTKTWSYEEFLAACLQREVSARESHGGEGRIRAARFPSRKSLEEFDFDHARGLKRDTIAHLGTLDFVTLAIGIAIRACQAGHRVLFATASQWVDRLAAAHHSGTLQSELIRLARYPLLVVDEVGYIPSNPKPPTCSSNWCRPATNGPASSSRQISPSGAGAKYSATTS